MSNICPYFPRCPACTNWHQPYEQQKADKVRKLTDLLNKQGVPIFSEIEFISLGHERLRHRADFSLRYDENTKKHLFGYYAEQKSLIDIIDCRQFSPELQKAYESFILFAPHAGSRPITRGSVRLRVSPDGLIGCWLDLSNLDIKDLLEDRHYLNSLLDAGFVVEIGQKAKILTRQNMQFKLMDPSPRAWFKVGENKKLFCSISDFTQPSWTTGNALSNIVVNWLDDMNKIDPIKKITEFGAGIGFFTVALLNRGYQVEALELEGRAAECLKINADSYIHSQQFQVFVGDYHKKDHPLSADAVLVNPARSGLKKFNENLIVSRPRHIIYVSCFAQSMTDDLKKLKEHYTVTDIKIVDQFPQTEHYESCVLLSRT